MIRQAQNVSHGIPPVFCFGIVDDNSTTKFRVKPELNFQLQTPLFDSEHNFSTGCMLVGHNPTHQYLLPRLKRRADSYASARRSFFDARGSRQNTFIINSNVSIAPATAQNSICSSERGIEVSSVLSNGASTCTEYLVRRWRVPEKASARLFPAVNIRSPLLSRPSAPCGRTKLRRISPQRAVSANGVRSSGSQATARHQPQHSWRSWTGLRAA